jgi:RNA polymerase sigma-70 factor (ECF subfamily)
MTKDGTSDTMTSFFEEIYKKNHDKLVNYSILYTKDIEASKEVVQDAFVECFIKILTEDFPTYEHARSWLYKTVLNMSLNRAREDEKTQSIRDNISTKSTEDFYFDSIQGIDKAQAIIKLTQSLSKGLNELFVIYYIRELSHKEAAEILNITESASKAKKSRLGKKCRKILKKAGFSFDFEKSKKEDNADGKKK